MKLIISILTLLLSSTSAFATEPSVTTTEQIKFVTDFYRVYLNRNWSKDESKNSNMPFLSTSAKGAIANNLKICREKSRGDDICGFDADFDMYLNAQEMSETLNFNNSDFQARQVDTNVIEISFTVFPESPKQTDPRQTLKFKLVKEESTWRVADVLYPIIDKNGTNHFEAMTTTIENENKIVLEEAKKISETWSWIGIYLSDTDIPKRNMSMRIKNFTHFPVVLCYEKGKCEKVASENKKFAQAVLQLNMFYAVNKKAKKNAHPFPKLTIGDNDALSSAKAGKSIINSPFTFSLINDTWWITEISLFQIK